LAQERPSGPRFSLAALMRLWTNDKDFLGTGVATWTTDTLAIWLGRQEENR
jgi:PIN domain